MKKIFPYLFALLSLVPTQMRSQESPKAEVFLLTCGPGLATYSVYGHSALRIVIPEKGSDEVYNWGVFDFSAPNFTWKFAKGRLDYWLGVYSYESFLQEYIYDKRWVMSQKINLNNQEIGTLFSLIADNLKPENIKYRYDFFYDDCSTRIRDLLEKAVGDKLIYPPEEQRRNKQTFRQLTGEYQKGYPWMKFGVDLIMGSPGDKKASFRDRMFLPIELQKGLSALVIRREGLMVPLLADPETVVESDLPSGKVNFFTSPVFAFSFLLILLIAVTGMFREKKFNRILDIVIFTVFSALAVLMIFFNFFTDHQQMKWNLNIIWLNPFIIMCLASLILDKDWRRWFQITLYLALAFLVFIFFLPQHINDAFVPITGILLLRSSIRTGSGWNPLTLPYLTEF